VVEAIVTDETGRAVVEAIVTDETPEVALLVPVEAILVLVDCTTQQFAALHVMPEMQVLSVDRIWPAPHGTPVDSHSPTLVMNTALACRAWRLLPHTRHTPDAVHGRAPRHTEVTHLSPVVWVLPSLHGAPSASACTFTQAVVAAALQ
jgi:hypothetical protein